MVRTPYKAKSLSGAQARVRRLEKALREAEERVYQLNQERIILAKLAAIGPAFYNPMDVMDAENLRDEILRKFCRLNPDGTPIKKAEA